MLLGTMFDNTDSRKASDRRRTMDDGRWMMDDELQGDREIGQRMGEVVRLNLAKVSI